MQFILDPKEVLSKYSSKNCAVLCDENTYSNCFHLLDKDLPYIIIKPGEKSKNLEVVQTIWSELLRLNMNRSSTLISLGGGVVTDIGGFVATTFMRGIGNVLVPTTLLGMVDASIGGKNGVNYKGLKNYIGTFSLPDNILICPQFLNSLPEEELVNGYAEMLKHGLIASQQHFNDLNSKIHNNETIDLALIKQSVSIKLQLTNQDLLDQGIRQRLNFGHTIAHAIEAYCSENNLIVSHGQAVLKGMLVEAKLAQILKLIDDDDFKVIASNLSPLLLTAWMPSWSEINKYLSKDKKNFNDELNFALITSIGSAEENIFVKSEQVKKAMEETKHD